MRTLAMWVGLAAVMICGQWVWGADTQPGGRTLAVSTVRSDDGKPIVGARAFYTIDGGRGVEFKFDDKGEGRIQLPAKLREVRLEIVKEGFAQYWITLGEGPRSVPLTDHYTAHMLKGITVGGTVLDENGKGVEGARVLFTAFYELPDHPGMMCNGAGVGTSDAQGRWTFNGAAGEPKEMISISAQHPDFLLSSSHQNLGLSQYEQLKKKELVTTIRRGISVPGVVSDREGKPIAKARVGQDSLGLVNGTTSDEQGKFVLRGVEAGKRQMMASADGYVAQEIDYVATAGESKPLEFKMERGRTLKGKVVDAKGEPVPEASISFVPFKQFPRMNEYARTDAKGEFVWNGAPETPVTASIYKQGYIRQGNLVWTAGSEPKVELAESPGGDPFARPTVMTVRGTVVDEQGKPVEKFQALISLKKAANPRMTWSMHGEGKDGKYTVAVSEPGDSFTVRIDADGYLPFESPSLTKEQVLKYDARLKRGELIGGVILRPDGQPAAKADVALREWYMLQVDNGEIGMMRNPQQTHATRADDSGRFQLPAREGRVRVFAVHASGWGEWIVNGQGPTPELKMWEWGKVEGTVLEKGKPVVGKTVRIQVYGRAEPEAARAEYSARSFFRYETSTDAHGHFAFDRVIDGTGQLQVEAAREGQFQRVVNGYTSMLELKPGEQRIVNFGGSGRPVVGKLGITDELKGKIEMPKYGQLHRVQPPFVPPPGYNNLNGEQKQDVMDAFHQTPDYQEYLSKPSGYGVTVNPDGSFRAEDVQAGDYHLAFQVLADRADQNGYLATRAWVTLAVKVPEIPGGKSDEPLEVGKLELQPGPQGPPPALPVGPGK